MDFSLSKTQEMLRKSARDFLEKECKDIARESEDTDAGFSSSLWSRIADLGWMGLGIPSEYGGLDGDFLEIIILAEEMGRVLFPGPFIPAVVCSGFTILEHGSETQKKEFLPDLTGGYRIVVPAVIEPSSPYGKSGVADRVETEDDYYIISGTRLFVPFAHRADWFICQTVNAGEKPTLFLVDKRSAGIDCTLLPSIASDKLFEVVLDNVKVPKENVLGPFGEGDTALRKMDALGSISYSAFMLGALEKVLEMTVGYAKDRVQFGRPIGSFQAIQHQCADMAIDMEQVRHLTYLAGWKLSQGVPADKEISMAKARASDASRRVSLLGVKIHGGIGIIDEYDMQLYFRKAKACEIVYGDAEYHREIIAQEIGLP